MAADTMISYVCRHLPARVASALYGIALLLSLAAPAGAQGGQAGSSATEPVGQCMASGAPEECADRCPSFDTCFIARSDQLYYRVGEQRFDCKGLDCVAATQELADYCCQRGKFAPSTDGDGGGCNISPGRGPAPSVVGGWFALALAAVATRHRRVAAAR